MLTKGDEYPIHQTAEPIAYSGTDRNFYDRYFFNGYQADGSDFFAIAFGVYPHLNVADAHFSCIRGDVQHCVHASRLLDMERMDLTVGPITIEIVEPLKSLRVIVDNHEGISANLTFVGRAFPVEEPRFTRRIGPRTFMDYTRMTQNGHWQGWIEVDGIRRDIDGAVGTRDRSWGIRPIGASDPQPTVPQTIPQFYWLWSPVNFHDGALYFHVNDDAQGRHWNIRAVWCPDGAAAHEMLESDACEMAVTLKPGWRHAEQAVLTAEFPDGRHVTAVFEPGTAFLMRGIGYGHPEWPHGGWKGALTLAREDIDLTTVEAGRADHLHIQAVSRVTMTLGNDSRRGTGILEQLILGAYEPLGLKSIFND
jgi:hypothetical protein